MFEIGDLVTYCNFWNRVDLDPGTWKITDHFREDIGYGDFVDRYEIQNVESGEIVEDVCWVQLELIEENS